MFVSVFPQASIITPPLMALNRTQKAASPPDYAGRAIFLVDA